MKKDEYIDKKELAARLKLTPRTIEVWCKQGRIPWFKIGHTVRYRWEDIQKHLAENCQHQPST
jgi:excisionase family DNA binding protein